MDDKIVDSWCEITSHGDIQEQLLTGFEAEGIPCQIYRQLFSCLVYQAD